MCHYLNFLLMKDFTLFIFKFCLQISNLELSCEWRVDENRTNNISNIEFGDVLINWVFIKRRNYYQSYWKKTIQRRNSFKYERKRFWKCSSLLNEQQIYLKKLTWTNRPLHQKGYLRKYSGNQRNDKIMRCVPKKKSKMYKTLVVKEKRYPEYAAN